MPLLALIMAFLLLLTGSVAAVPHSAEFAQFDLAAGYRIDAVRWNSSFVVTDEGFILPNCDCVETLEFLSKLKWKDLSMYHVQGSARYVTKDRFYFRGVAGYGKIWHGHHTDKDFIEAPCLCSCKCHCKQQFLGSRASSNKGEAFDLSGGIGYYVRYLSERAALAPIVGYSHHEQHLRMSNLEIVLNEIDFDIGHIPGLHSNYRSKWYGPWVGMDFSLKMTCNLELYGRGEFHWTRFRGTGHWNLRPEFIRDFKQRARGYGQIYYVGINYDFTKLWKFGIAYNFQQFHSTSGTLRQFFSQGHLDISLHSVHWMSQSVLANIEYVF